MQGFYFPIKVGLVVLKAYCQKSSLILLRKKYVELITCIFLLKRMYLLNFERFFCLESRNYSQNFSLEIFFRYLFNSNY